MHVFTTYDGTELAYHVQGDGEPLICLPGGAMRASRYLGDLGGLTAGRRLVRLDLRGTGDSAIPVDEATYRVDHQVADVEALRVHLGLERMDLLGHSAAGNLAMLYAAAHPERVGRLVLVTPTPWAVGLHITAGHHLDAARLRPAGEPYDSAVEALRRLLAGEGADKDRDLAAPLFHGRWDDAARALHAAGAAERNDKASAAFAADGAFDPPATRAALGRFAGEVLVMAGELDGSPPPVLAAELAGLFPAGVLDVQPGAAHFPWLDDAPRFAARVEHFLSTGT
ncbi:pimeloyl-ACP methyl ester carboxylesterase [Streptomyces sp. Ag109_G2-6]|uniref:alpha/beta fold hydrolase n=1 Tax=Streptomyces TaxID=1883 RepID=UPI0009A5059A|nr:MULTISPECIES: alpha/beta hydrolase [Streptomyces]RPF29444.1 pimeloyl-ACP methyl ester carboxylesterase [Streptomyces sp. Ag109_G2-6]